MGNSNVMTRRYLTLFKIWLKNNAYRFPVPVFINSHELGLKLSFADVTNELDILISPDKTILIGVIHKNCYWTILAEFEIFEAKIGKLLYCSHCKKTNPFTTKYDYYVNHNFQPFLNWACENMVSGNWLHIYYDKYSNRVARITKKKPKHSNLFSFSTPLIKGGRL